MPEAELTYAVGQRYRIFGHGVAFDIKERAAVKDSKAKETTKKRKTTK